MWNHHCIEFRRRGSSWHHPVGDGRQRVVGSSQCDWKDPRRQSDHVAITESFFRKIDLLHSKGTTKTEPSQASPAATGGKGTSPDPTTTTSTKRAIQIRRPGDSWNSRKRSLLRKW